MKEKEEKKNAEGTLKEKEENKRRTLCSLSAGVGVPVRENVGVQAWLPEGTALTGPRTDGANGRRRETATGDGKIEYVVEGNPTGDGKKSQRGGRRSFSMTIFQKNRMLSLVWEADSSNMRSW